MFRPSSLLARLAMACMLAPLHLPLCILTELGATNRSPVIRVAKQYTIGVLRLVTYLDAMLVAERSSYVSAALVVSRSSARSRAVEMP